LADVCEKHNIKLLTYGTFVRITLSLSIPPRIAFRSRYPLSSFTLTPCGSAAVSLQMLGWTGPNLIRTPGR